jgi:hypothetical protein
VEERLRLDYSVDGGTLHLPPSQDLIAADRRRPNSDHLVGTMHLYGASQGGMYYITKYFRLVTGFSIKPAFKTALK